MTELVRHIESSSHQRATRKKEAKWFEVSATYTLDCVFYIEARNEAEVRELLEGVSSESEILALDTPNRRLEFNYAGLEVTDIQEEVGEKDGDA